MKKLFVLTGLICLLSMAAFAQKANFAGTWTLDTGKSKLGERSQIESMTMTVSHTDKELKVETATKRPAPPADAPQTGRMGGRGGMGDGITTYAIDGKETTMEVDGPNGKMPIKLKAVLEANKASLTSSRSFSSPMGEIMMTTKDSWAMSADGKTLTVIRESTSPRGTNSSTMVFVKN